MPPYHGYQNNSAETELPRHCSALLLRIRELCGWGKPGLLRTSQPSCWGSIPA